MKLAKLFLILWCLFILGTSIYATISTLDYTFIPIAAFMLIDLIAIAIKNEKFKRFAFYTHSISSALVIVLMVVLLFNIASKSLFYTSLMVLLVFAIGSILSILAFKRVLPNRKSFLPQ
eukprot:NODE_395_length_8134_cov_0.767393.p9 type:complete len:119 gc:universal NODE_395_length_8134_cov_0.767393:243-599(+)